jgi:hypothetical protein
MRRGDVARIWGLDPSNVPRNAERLNVRTRKLPGETRYHPGDVDRALRQMQGETIVSDAARRLSGSWAEGRSIWDVDPGTTGRDWGVELISAGAEPAPEHIAVRLGVQAGEEVIVRRRRYRVDGRLVLLATAYLPADLAAGTAMAEEDTGPGGIWKRLADAGHPPATAPETLSGRGATDYEAEQLQVEPGSPVMEMLRVTSTADGRVVDVSEMVAVPRYFRHYVVDL